MELDNTFWAFISLLIFLGVVIYLKVPQALMGTLDGRIKKIEEDLNEAKRLREEAQALLADYERKRKTAEAEATDIVTAAQEEAKRMATEAEASLADLIARRTKAAEDKIAQAEAQALAEVRSRSADVAIDAAKVLLTKQVESDGDALVDKSIKDVAGRLH